MRQVKLFIYNYGIKQVADFKSNYHDAVSCMYCLNAELISAHGKLPESIFYYLEYKIKSNKTLTYIGTKGNLSLYDAQSVNLENARNLSEYEESKYISQSVKY